MTDNKLGTLQRIMDVQNTYMDYLYSEFDERPFMKLMSKWGLSGKIQLKATLPEGYEGLGGKTLTIKSVYYDVISVEEEEGEFLMDMINKVI